MTTTSDLSTADARPSGHLALLIGGFRRLGLGEPMRNYPFQVLHPEATVQDTYDETVAALGFDPLCVHGAARCAGDECCCLSTHKSPFGRAS